MVKWSWSWYLGTPVRDQRFETYDHVRTLSCLQQQNTYAANQSLSHHRWKIFFPSNSPEESTNVIDHWFRIILQTSLRHRKLFYSLQLTIPLLHPLYAQIRLGYVWVNSKKDFSYFAPATILWWSYLWVNTTTILTNTRDYLICFGTSA